MRVALVFAFALAAAAGPAASQPAPDAPAVATTGGAFLNITPKRITFDKTRRIGTVFLLNQGAQPITVDVALIDRVMLPDGQIFAVEDAGRTDDGKAVAAQLRSARDLLQVSPRRVTLQPNRPQTVRVRLATLPEAAAGERRTHLTVTTLPPRETGATPEEAANPATGGTLSFQITAVYGLSIPVIVRAADPEVSAQLEGARVEFAEASPDGRAAPRRIAVVALDLVRGGASSVYGNFEVRVVGEKKDAEPLGLARGVAVYPEVARRVVRIPLTRAPAPGEKLEVTFTDDDTSPGKVLAKAAL
jgi:P pilus assembly chaperone PapD